MKNKVLILFFVVAALVLVFGQVGLAQDMKGKFGIGARIGYVNYKGDDINLLGSNIDVDFDAAAMYGGNLTYYIQRYLSLELSVDYVKTDTEIKGVYSSPTKIGELEQVPIILNGRFHFSTNQKISPYLSAGIGYYLNDFEVSNTSSGDKVDADDSFGFNLGGGIQFLLNEHFAIDLDLKYIWNKTDFQIQAAGEPTDESSVYLDNFYAGIGLKYYF